MKGKKKSLWVFMAGTVVGIVIGATTTYKIASQPYQNILADQYVTSVIYNTDNALRLRQGHQTEVAEHIQSNFPNNVLMIDHEFKNHPMANRALKDIKFYYQKNNIPVPANIQPVLGNLPK